MNVGRPRPDVAIYMTNRIVTEETRKRSSVAHLGVKLSDEHKRKLKIARNNRTDILSDDARNKISLAHKGKKLSKEHIKKLSNYARHRSIEHRKKLGLTRSGAKSIFWKGGLTEKNLAIRNSFEYKLWRKSIFERDNYTCLFCNKRGGVLHADHIKQFATHHELRFSLSNGRTLCVDCHRKTDTYAVRPRLRN